MHNLVNLSHSQLCDSLYEDRDIEFEAYQSAIEANEPDSYEEDMYEEDWEEMQENC